MKTSYVEMAKKLREATGKPKPADAFLADLERRETEREAKHDAEFAQHRAEFAQHREDLHREFAGHREDLHRELAGHHRELTLQRWVLLAGLALIGAMIAVNSV